MPELEMVRDAAVQDLLDKQAIREAVMRYCRGADRCDAELINSAYHPDAIDDHPGGRSVGAAIGPGIASSLQERMQSTSHQIGTQLIEVTGDTAACESYSTGAHIMKDGRRLRTLVRYLDRFERRAGEWKIVHRLVITEATEVLPPPDSAPLAPSSARRDREDPSYGLFDGSGTSRRS
jgi:ketosteroid isomerase-like protein